jgi:ATP-dependent helicase HrpA
MEFRSLPVYRHREKILDALQKNRVLVVESPTGSGKTTQLPLILLESGLIREGMVGVTQPRRIAAVSVSQFIAAQIGETVPGTVGYKMRFEDITSPETRLKIMTDGILLQELKADPLLSDYGCIVVDEAHERSLNIDFILGLLKRILKEREDFKVLISSATINAEIFSEYFWECPTVHIETETYPIETIYRPVTGDRDAAPDHRALEDRILREIVSIVETEGKDPTGDILIFLPGQSTIQECVRLLSSNRFETPLYLLPLYGRLSKEEQDRVFPPPPAGRIKVVVATNIAETSITVDGVTTVIDSGLAKINIYNPRTFTSALIQTHISKASCNQRRGRAGRTRPGRCYRLYSEEDYEQRQLFTIEEIYRTDLSEVVLRMAELGIHAFESFDFLSQPSRRDIHSAVETLKFLDALDEEHRLTDIGRRMVLFPLLPRLSRMVIEAVMRYPDVIEEVLIAASFLSTMTPFLLPPGEEYEARRAHHSFRDDFGDFVSYLKIFKSYTRSGNKQKFTDRYYLDHRTMTEIVNIEKQLEEIVGRLGAPIGSGGSKERYLCAVSVGLKQFVCAGTGRGVYNSLTAERIFIHPGSVMFKQNPRYIVAGEIMQTSRMYARSVSPLRREWLPAISSELVESFVGGGRSSTTRKRPAEKATTWQVRVGHLLFELKPYKGKKKIAVIEWERIRPLIQGDGLPELTYQHNLRGTVTAGKREFLSGERLGTIFKVLPYIDPDTDYVRSWPRDTNFILPDDARNLCNNLGLLMKLASLKGNGTRLGFLTLQTDGSGVFWFTCIKRVMTALDSTMGSIEALTDEIDESAPGSCFEYLNSAFRRLSRFY